MPALAAVPAPGAILFPTMLTPRIAIPLTLFPSPAPVLKTIPSQRPEMINGEQARATATIRLRTMMVT